MKRIAAAILALPIAWLLGYSLAFAQAEIKTTDGPGGWQRDGNRVRVQNPGQDKVILDNWTSTTSITVTEVDPVAMPILTNLTTEVNGKLDQSTFDGYTGNVNAATLGGEVPLWFTSRENMTGFQIASTISDFGDAVVREDLSSGIESHTPGDDNPIKVTFTPWTSNLVDIAEGDCHVQGVEYPFTSTTSVNPEFGGGENSSWFGCSASGLVKQATKFTDVQKRTIMPIARIQAAGSATGPGSPISRLGILDHRWQLHEPGFRWEKYFSGAIGALFQTGGLITENGVTPLNLDMSTGKLWNSDRDLQTWSGFTNLSGLHKFHNSTTLIIQEETFAMDNVNWDNGENLTPMTNNNYHCSHSILMSPRGTQDSEFSRLRVWWVHCTSEWPDLQGAIDSGIDFGAFVDQDASGLVPLAQVIVKKNTANVVTVIDARPRIGAAGGTITSGSVTLQGAYNNSSPGSSEIVLNAAQDGFTISDNATPVGALFKVNNFANTTSFAFVNVSGIRSSGHMRAAGALEAGTTLDVAGNSQQRGDVVFGNNTAVFFNASSGFWGFGTPNPDDGVELANKAIHLTGNVAFDAGLPGRIYVNSVSGLSFVGVAGASNDLVFATPAGQSLIANPTGTKDILLATGTPGMVAVFTGAPHSRLHSDGSLAITYDNISSTSFSVDDHFFLDGYTNDNDVTFNIVTLVGKDARFYDICKTSASNKLFVDPAGSESVAVPLGGTFSVYSSFSASDPCIRIMSDGVNWVRRKH